MAKGRRVVIQKKALSDRLPDWASEGSVLAECLAQGGILEEIGKRLLVQREGGYVGLDVLLFLLFYFASELKIGLKEFGRRTKPYRRQLAALGGRIRFPTPPSVSRFLGAVERPDIQAFGPWLLFEGTGAREVLKHPSTMHRDTRGGAWHFFDWDPTSTVLRQRALPVLDGLPEGKRRSDEMKSGYRGRKRGEVQLSRATLQHAGSGLWLGIWMAPGNGEPKMGFDEALQTIQATCQQAGLAPENAVIRSDGQGGNVPYIAACQSAKIRYLTRWGKYGLLKQAEIREHLNQSTWYAVSDSGSGPRREAAELGWFELAASRHTRQPDGRRYEAVRSRLIVSRFRTDKLRGSGILIDGWQYELFATDLEEEPWPAAEVVTSYYGRCGQENRFAQEDRELELDRIFSYDVPGQELANLIGLFVWNLRICHGMNLADPPRELPAQQPRVPIAIEDPAKLPNSTSIEGQKEGAGREATTTAPSRPATTQASMQVNEVSATSPGHGEKTTTESGAAPRAAKKTPAVAPAVERLLETNEKPAAAKHDQALDGNDTEQPAGPFSDANKQLLAALNRLDWSTLLKGKPNWTWDPKRGLVCPGGVVVPLTSIKRFPTDNRRHLRFKAPHGTCPFCERKSDCTSSSSLTFRKEASLSLPAHEAASIGALLVESRPASASTKRWQDKDVAAPQGQRKPPSHRSAMELIMPTWERPGRIDVETPFSITSPILLPAELRRIFREKCLRIETHVSVDALSLPTPVRVFALTPGERQRRRLSWTQRHEWNQLPDDAKISIRFADGFGILPLLRVDSTDSLAA